MLHWPLVDPRIAAITDSLCASTSAFSLSSDTFRTSSIFGSGVLISKRSAIRRVFTPSLAAVVAFLEVACFAVEPFLDAVPLQLELSGQIERFVFGVFTLKIQNKTTPSAFSETGSDNLVNVIPFVRPDFADGVHGISSDNCFREIRNPHAPL